MSKDRLQAFSDGVIAIIITIMVLELKVPHGHELRDLLPLVPVFMSYVLSFALVAIYWNNHHHMLQAASEVNASILWANMYLLFWLSLVPFVTGWMGENDFANVPVALYGFVQLMAALAYYNLAHALARHHGQDSAIATAIGSDIKGKASLLMYVVAVPLALYSNWAAFAIYVAGAVMWFVPDKRMEKALAK